MKSVLLLTGSDITLGKSVPQLDGRLHKAQIFNRTKLPTGRRMGLCRNRKHTYHVEVGISAGALLFCIVITARTQQDNTWIQLVCMGWTVD